MKLRFALLASAALVTFSLSARAADITFNVTNGVFSPSGSFTGSFLINPTNELIDGGQFTVTAPSGGTVYTFFNSANTSPTGGLAFFHDVAGDNFRLALNGPISALVVNTFANFGTGADTFFSTAAGARFDATSATITQAPATSATPEPSSLILLGTGALGFVGAFRRRFLNS